MLNDDWGSVARMSVNVENARFHAPIDRGKLNLHFLCNCISLFSKVGKTDGWWIVCIPLGPRVTLWPRPAKALSCPVMFFFSQTGNE